jgi:hypothetical protein
MSNITTKDQEMVSLVEKRNSLVKGGDLISQTKSIKFNVLEEEMSELNQALAKAKDQMQLVPQPTSGIGKWFMEKTPKLSIWFMEKVQGKKFADADSLDKIEIILETYDQTFNRLQQNIEPTRKLQESILERIKQFKDERNRVADFLVDNPETPSKEFLQLHVDKLEGTIGVMENTAIVWLNNNIANRMKMYATAAAERKQLEVTLVAGVNTLKATQEVKKAAEILQTTRDLTNQIQQFGAEANTEMEIAVASATTKSIFTEETLDKIQLENERAQTLVAQTKQLNAEENERLRLMLENFDPQTSSVLDDKGADLLEETIGRK